MVKVQALDKKWKLNNYHEKGIELKIGL